MKELMGQGLKVFNQKRDLAGAEVSMGAMREHAANSLVTLALLSPSFFASKYCRAEVEAADASEFCQAVVPVYSGDAFIENRWGKPTDLKRDEAPEKQAAIKAVFVENIIDVHNPAHMDQCVSDVRTKIVERFCVQ